MRNVAVLSALTFALVLSACNGPLARTPDPVTAREVSGTPAPAVAAPFDLVTDAAVLARTGLSITLVGRELVLKETKLALNVRLRLPDGSYSPATGGEKGQSLATAQYIGPVVLGTVIEVGQATFEPVATITLKPRPEQGQGTLTSTR
ncbi:hypothetical protein [uncultured Deinococcus sp.]|uniref:hypothetical protein n=1 Tax=uncultured Deinococcus sp. TaxID=158789 RepID=UPI002584E9A0|nr:hypothetical protein [uncultured Deinococcus sp.]